MQKILIILALVFLSTAVFGQTKTSKTTEDNKSVKAEKTVPHYGVYEDLDDMKSRFKAFEQIQKQEKAIAETPQDETIWESAKGPDDFDGPKRVNTYGMERPTGYASKVEREKVDKQDLSKSIRTSLILSKSPAAPKESADWEFKLKKN
jgi:hypothetical protein